MKRRDLIKGLTLLPVGGAILPVAAHAGPLAGAAAGAGPLVPGPGIFQSIGVEPLINCMGTFTIIGGSLERPTVRAAMDAASKNFVQYDELADGVGRRMAELTGAEYGMVSAGCAAGMKHVTAACVTGGNPEKLIRIPNLAGFEKTEVIIPESSRNVYDHAIRNIGVTIITVSDFAQYESALGSRTAMVYLMADSPAPFTTEAVVKAAKAKNIPVMVDAAAEDMTIPNVHLQVGVDVVVYSGGKALCGPQCSGIVLGRKDILKSAWQASAPHHGPGRDNKVGREEMIGALAAIEAWVTFDHKAQWTRWLSYLDTITKKVTAISGVSTKMRPQEGRSNNSPSMSILWDVAALNITGEEVAEELGRNKPRIALSFMRARKGGTEPEMNGIIVTAAQMQPGEDKIVAERLSTVLSKKRDPKPAGMKPASTSLAGHWDVEISFSSSTSTYGWIVEQEGNIIAGLHTGPFSTQDLAGTLDGSTLRLRSASRPQGDQVAFTYSAEVKGDTLSGSVYMIEYGTATFTAKRHVYPKPMLPISVPGGPPLAT